MKVKSILFKMFCLLSFFTLVGCSAKTAITSSDFIKCCEDKNLHVEDISGSFIDNSDVNEVVVATSEEGWTVEFYIFSDESVSKQAFEANKKKFEDSKSGVFSEKSVSIKNYSTYRIKSNGDYMYICRVDNTLVYVCVDDVYENSVINLLSELGY